MPAKPEKKNYRTELQVGREESGNDWRDQRNKNRMKRRVGKRRGGKGRKCRFTIRSRKREGGEEEMKGWSCRRTN